MLCSHCKNCHVLFVGGYDKEEKAARSYDLAALKYWGPTATTNFPVRVTSCLVFYVQRNPML